MSSYIVILTTTANDDEAGRIARDLVDNRLAACVNIVGPVRSVYRWKDEVHDDREHLLVIKTVRERFEQIREHVGELHSYELPELIALPLEAGDENYLNWLSDHATGLRDEPS